MILPIQHTVRGRLIEAVGRLYGIPSDDPALASIAIEMPPRRALGDLALPLAFELARRLRKAPRAIAQEFAAALGPIEGIASRRGGAQRLPEPVPRPPGRAHSRLAVDQASRRPSPATARPSSSTRRSTRTRPPTSAIFGMPRSATRSSGCCASGAPGRNPELHRRHRRPGRRRRGRLPRARTASRSTRSGASPTQRASTTTAGISTRGSRSGTSRTRSGSRSAPTTLHDIEHGGNDTADLGALHRRSRSSAATCER